MDFSSELIHSLLPVFLVTTLGASTLTLGLVEGIAEGTALISKVFSGVLSDRFARRKPLVVLGYGLAALSKPLFPLATSAAWVLGARFMDRIAKGIRGAPRDALVADATPPAVRGAAYGLRQALDTAGALLGPLAAIFLMGLLGDNVRAVFWIAAIPAFAAVVVLVVGVKEPQRHVDPNAPQALPRWRDLAQLGGAFWAVATIGAVITLARFSEAFLVLRANQAGLSFAWTPLALAVMNATYVASAYPAGRLSDRIDRVWLLVIGLAVLIVADIMLAWGEQVATILAGVAIWGLHMGLTQGLLAALVADTAPAELRGSAFGMFNFVSGLVALVASLLAGGLWHWYGPAPTFYVGAFFSAAALAGLLWWRFRYAVRSNRV
jgi:MFS family permease